jgi:hypothetical protein
MEQKIYLFSLKYKWEIYEYKVSFNENDDTLDKYESFNNL